MTQEQEYILLKYCPNCYSVLRINYDYLKLETTCRSCGLVLRGPPEYGIIYPEVITREIKR